MRKLTLYTGALLFGATLSITPVVAEEVATKEVFISPGVVKVPVKHNGKDVQLMRIQKKKNEIVEFYRRTDRGKIQPMDPFKPHTVNTIGELEMIDYVKQKSAGDDKLMIIDSRTPDWVKRSGVIPTAVNIPFTEFKESTTTMEIMEDQFDVLVGETFDFSNAKTLVMYCNGNWCAQSPTAIKKLLAMGYPAAKLKYYRGGMQSWTSLGLTVVQP
ncbi:MAG: rhodanese-like domain-containing protein [bacterium]